MRVRILVQLRGAHGAFEPGQVADLPDDVAEAWREAGVVSLAEAPSESSGLATAMLAPAQTAVVRPARGRGRGRR